MSRLIACCRTSNAVGEASARHKHANINPVEHQPCWVNVGVMLVSLWVDVDASQTHQHQPSILHAHALAHTLSLKL